MFYSLIYIGVFVLSLILVFNLKNVRKSELGMYMIVVTSLLSFWLIIEGTSYLAKSGDFVVFLQKIKYISVVSIPPLIFITSLIITFGKKNIKWYKSIILFVIPVLTLLSLVTNLFPYTFINNPSAVYEGEMLVYSYDIEIGFIIHASYSYLMLLLSNVVLVYRIIKSPKLYKNQSFVIASGSNVTFLFNILFITSVIGDGKFDTTPIFVFFSLCVYYWGLYIMPGNKLQIEARSLLVENVSDLMIILDNQSNVVDINTSALTFFSKLYKKTQVKELISSDYLNVPLERVLNQLHIDDYKKKILQGQIENNIEFIVDEDIYYYHFQRRFIFDETKKSIGELILLHDITSTQIYLKQLIGKNKELAISDAVIENARESIVILDKYNEIIKVNSSMLSMSGYTTDEVIGNRYSFLRSDQHDILFYEKIWDSVSSRGYWEGEMFGRRKNGEIYLEWMSYTIINDENDEVAYYVIISSDISKLKKAEDDLVHMAYYDSLTNLPNRVLFRDRLKSALLNARKNKSELALLYIDIDKFKEVNDNLGHLVGDQLLIIIAEMMKKTISENDIIARLGGDEFTIILENIKDVSEVALIAQNIIEALEKPIFIDEIEINIMVSIGIAIGTSNDLSEDALIGKADIAMYQAKKSSGPRYCFISEEMEQSEKLRYQMNMDLKKAFQCNEFSMHLHPQISIINGIVNVVGAEALMRWKTSEGVNISPVDFIPVAEENGMIHKMGIWIFEEIFRMNKVLRNSGFELDLSINVSVRQFDGTDFMDKIETLVSLYNTPINLTIEITESLFFDDLEKGIENLLKLKSFGFKIAMDDFGTGFSSMSYLKRLPLDYVKIDKSFIDDIEVSSKKNLADMVLTLASLLDLKTVAEGVETTMQALHLIDAGCDLLQGYLYSKPLDFDSFMNYLENI